MTLDRREVVERFFGSGGDVVDILGDDADVARRRAELEPHVASGFSVHLVAGEAANFATAEYEGYEGFIAAWQEWTTPYESYRFEIERVREAGETVVVDARQHAVLHGGAQPLELDVSALWVFEDDRLARIEFHLDRAHAHRVAGL